MKINGPNLDHESLYVVQISIIYFILGEKKSRRYSMN